MSEASRSVMAAARERTESVLGGLDAGSAARLGSELASVAGLLDGNYPLRRALGESTATPSARADLARRVLGSQVAPDTLDIVASVVSQTWAGASELSTALADLAADAVLAAAEKDGRLDDVEDELFRFARTLEREPQLSLALSNPALPLSQKTKLLDRLLEGKAQQGTRTLITAALTAGGGHGLERRLDQLTVVAAARRQRLVAVVRVAATLTEDQAERLRAALARTYGRDVHLQVDIDPTVLGGAIVQVGDEILDGSVARRISQARARL